MKREGYVERVSEDQRVKVRLEYASEDDLKVVREFASWLFDWAWQVSDETETS